MSWTWAALTPHPPILVPEVGRGREREAQKTLDGMAVLTKRLEDAKPDALLLLSPHQPAARGALFLNAADRARGSLAPFGAPSVSLDLPAPVASRSKLAQHLLGAGIALREGDYGDLTPDHAALVPLHFLNRAWGGLPSVILASPIGLPPASCPDLGAALARFDDGLRWGLVASGDLSHRLTPDAPAGYSPRGREFDERVVEALRMGDAGLLSGLSPDFLEDVGECGLRSVLTMLGLCGALGGTVDVLSYEGPFGVGYCCALCDALRPPREEARPERHPYAVLAREVVRRHVSGATPPEEPSGDPDLWARRAACFVSIKRKDGSLRGCIGTLAPTRPSLFFEILANAVSAATQDPRFAPMTRGELDGVVFSVDVLSEPEPVADTRELDPAVWGVIVSKGGRRGVLLPDLEGVDDVRTQLSIAAQKAGIRDLDGAAIERFRVRRCS